MGGKNRFILPAAMILIAALIFYWSPILQSVGNTVENFHTDSQFVASGEFYDAGYGRYFASSYDVFVHGISKGHFNSALEACQTLFPNSVKVDETNSRGIIYFFTNRNGNKNAKESFLNICLNKKE
jgi:hypothetical protein